MNTIMSWCDNYTSPLILASEIDFQCVLCLEMISSCLEVIFFSQQLNLITKTSQHLISMSTNESLLVLRDYRGLGNVVRAGKFHSSYQWKLNSTSLKSAYIN